jgi:steroid delta-isomerase-like uncharacterized protein
VPVSDDSRQRREAVVREHLDAEDRHDAEAALATFRRPRYELIASGQVFDGAEEVMGYYNAMLTAFPDADLEILALHHADDAVIVESKLRGTHEGALYGVPATGRRFELQGIAVFQFEDDELVCERIYSDTGTMLRQLGLMT